MLKYRPEIDGLRAIAVMAVIIYHAGFSFFSGGYVGVDIFFVISGFLITGIIFEEVLAGNFSFAEFYERRARRILPALFLVVLCTIPAAWVLLSPQLLIQYAQSVGAVVLFASNILFYEQSNYFDPSAQLKPLLQTWSLAVEEQFYIVFPVILMVLRRCQIRLILTVLSVFVLASISYSQWAVRADPDANFYLIFSRIFEMMLGAIAAIIYKRRLINLSPRAQHYASLIGIGGIISAILLYDHNTPFPSLYALVPVLGTATILLIATHETWVGKLLSSKPFVWVGLVSYSAYLWHQPLFAFARNYGVTDSQSIIFTILIGLTLLLAYASWRFVEQPFRNRKNFSRAQIFSFAIVGSLFFISVAVFGYIKHGFPKRFGDFANLVYQTAKYENHRLYRVGKCQLDAGGQYKHFASECFDEPNRNAPHMLLWGDSLISGAYAGIKKIYPDFEIEQLVYGGCPPVIFDYTFHKDRPYCQKTYEQIVARIIENKEIKRFYMLGNWQYYYIEHPNIADNIAKTVAYIESKRPDLQIIVLGPVPKWKGLPGSLVKEWGQFSDDLYKPSLSYETDKKLDDELAKTIQKQTKATYVSVLDLLCPKNNCLVANYDSQKQKLQIWTFDTGHMTEWGAGIFAEKLRHKLEQMGIKTP